MKKLLPIIVALMLMLSVFACAEPIRFADYGFELDFPKEADDAGISPQQLIGDDCTAIRLYYVNADVMVPVIHALEELQFSDTATDAEIEEALQAYSELFDQHAAPYFDIVCVTAENTEEALAANDIPATAEYIGSSSKYAFYLAPVEENPLLVEEDIAAMEAARPFAQAVVDSLKIFEPEDHSLSSEAIPFETVDMNGETVTESIFAQADLTILNIWATHCNPCIREMPELAQWSRELPENVQLVGLVSDVNSASASTFAKAQKIISKCGVDFTNILMSDSLKPILDSIAGTPTTLFFGRDGVQVAEPVVGANVPAYKETVEAFLAAK